MTIRKEKYHKYKEAAKYWVDNKTNTSTLVLVHCIPDLEGNEDYDTIKTDQGVIKLLILTQKIFLGRDETKHSIMAPVDSDMDLYTTQYGPNQLNTEFLWSFKSIVAAIEANRGGPWIHVKMYDLYLAEAAALAPCDVSDATKETKEVVIKISANEYLACLFQSQKIPCPQTGNS